MKKQTKRIVSLVLSLLMLISMVSVSASAVANTALPTAGAGDTYNVAGEAGLCGVAWTPSENTMTLNSDGNWELTFTAVPAGTYAWKVATNGQWDIGDYNEVGLTGDGNSDNATITLSATDDVRIVFYPNGTEDNTAPHAYAYSNSRTIITEHTYTIAGNADMCGTNWEPTDTNNDMSEIIPGKGVYGIQYPGVEDGEYEFKVVQDHSWGKSWGDDTTTTGNAVATVTEIGSTVLITFDSNTGEISVAVLPPQTQPTTVAPTTAEPTTAEPTTVAPTTAEPTTVAPTTAEPTTAEPTTVAPTTAEPTTAAPTEAPTEAPTAAPTTAAPTEAPTQPSDTYNVAGEAGLCGAAWDPSANAMTLNADGNWELTFTAVPAGTYAWKVATNGQWNIGDYNEIGLTNETDNKDNATITLSATDDVRIVFYPNGTEDNPAPHAYAYSNSRIIIANHTYTVAGNGDMCGTNWDPADTNNDMTEIIADTGMYAIQYTNVEDGDYEFKVVEDHSWGKSWGDDTRPTGNAVATVTEIGSTVIITFDSNTGEIGVSVLPPETQPTTVAPTTAEPTTVAPTTAEPTTAEPTTAEPTTAEPTTVAPTTAEPTTAAPTTAEPTTAEPTTVAPTTAEPTTAAPTTAAPTEAPTQPSDTYNVAGEAGLCGAGWDPSANQMTKNIDGNWELTFTAVPAGTYAWKVATNGQWDIGDYNEIGLTNDTDNKGNATITLSATDDVRIVFYPNGTEDNAAPHAYAYSNSRIIITNHTYTVAGNGDMCGTNWDPADTNNDMTEIIADTGMYAIQYTNVEDGDYEFKVVEDHSWGKSWGDDTRPTGNAVATVTEIGSTVIITFDSNTGEIGVSVLPPETQPTTVAPTTAEPTTVAPTTAEPTTAEPTTAEPTTAEPTTAEPTTAEPTTAEPTTAEPTTAEPTTAEPTTAEPTTAEPTTAEPTTAEPTTAEPTTAEPTTAEPTTPTEPSNTYNVAGEAGLCGAGWDPSANQMTLNADGNWELTFTAVPAGTYAWKVATNGQWDIGDYNEIGLTNDTDNKDNATITLSATDDVRIVFYPNGTEDNAAPHAYAYSNSRVIITDHTYTVAGNGDMCGTNWDPADTNNDMVEISDGVYTLVFYNVRYEGEYEFKIVEDHSWGKSWGDETSATGNAMVAVPYNNCAVEITFVVATGEITTKVLGRPTVTVGDLTGDGNVSMRDIQILQNAILSDPTQDLTADQQLAADVNGDGIVSLRDVLLMQLYITDQLDKFPVDVV